MKERLVSGVGSVSGVASILGSWQVCHSLCLAAIAALGVIGISLTGMPFLFLTEIVVYVWGAAVVLLAITAYLYWTRRCISRSLLMVNSGLILAGTPFWESLSPLFWVFGGLAFATGVAMFFYDRRQRECCNG